MTNIFNGVPHNNEAAVALDSNIILFIKSDVLYTYNMTTNTTSSSPLQDTFPEIPTGLTAWLIGAGSNNIHSETQIPILCSDSNYYYYYFTITNGIPTFTYNKTTTQQRAHLAGDWQWGWLGINTAVNTDEVNTGSLYTKGGSMYLWSGGTDYYKNYPLGQGDVRYDGAPKLGEVAYGGTGQPFDGLPHNLDSMFALPNNLTAYAFKGSMWYELSIVSVPNPAGTGVQAVIGGTLVGSGSFIPVVNLFNGVPHDHQASGKFPNDPTITYFIYYDGTINKVYRHDSTSNTTTIHDIGSGTNQFFSGIPTNQAVRVMFFESTSVYFRWDNPLGGTLQIRFTSPTTAGVDFRPVTNNVLHSGETGNQSKQISWFPTTEPYEIKGYTLPNFGILWQYAAGAWGGTNTPFNGLPQTGMNSLLTIQNNNDSLYLFYDTGIVYTLNITTQAVVSSAPYGSTIPPPTPLTPIEVVYQAPAQFNLFSNNVALVTETQYGWNFTKTILTSDKMLLYLYHSSAPGAVAFNYNQLRDIQVNMKNNLALPTGEIFMTVYTGPPVAPNWYNYKDIYNMTPALGTTVDIDLVLTTLNLTDTRTDPILAIALHSNSGQQQVNCDVERVSFEVLLPATNNTQRVIVKLQNNFIVVDDKYWDLENNAVAKLGTTILPGFQLSDFSPNIIAGNYPQSGTAKEVPSGAAWYLKGTYTEWIQNVANTWVVSGNTIEFTSNAVNPGVDTNGAAYIGCLGGVALTGTWSPTPFTWEITASNQLKILNTDGSTITFSPLVDLPQPNNFTAVQAESGCFSSSNVGTLATTALISNSVASFKSPIFPTEIDLTFLSESQVIIRRSWEIVDTTYTITSSNVLSGQYVSPTYPNNGNLNLPPDSYNMPTEWVVLANNDSQFFIEFSGGLNNTITSDGAYNMAVNPVGPSPITYAWTANYYTSADVLISPVVGFGATGSVSNFTIALASVPASAEYILYVCTSSENVQAFASLVIIQAAAAIPFVLDFQNQSSQIVVDATYTVTPNPVDAGATYAYTATYNNEFDASLGNVLGAVASGPQSSFNFVYANIPTGTKYINYTCNATGGNQGGETARLSISIIPQIPPAPQPFELEFNGGAYPVNITADGTYNMIPYPTESALIITYTYTANYFAGTTDLGPVVGFDVTGQSSSFPFTFAGMPSGATYIKYICSASGTGLQNGETAESIIGIVPPGGNSPDVDLIRSTTGSIIFNQYNSEDSLKLLTADRIAGLTMTLTDSYGDNLYSPAPVYYELNVRSSNSG